VLVRRWQVALPDLPNREIVVRTRRTRTQVLRIIALSGVIAVVGASISWVVGIDSRWGAVAEAVFVWICVESTVLFAARLVAIKSRKPDQRESSNS
jgi:hypothetical protein